MGIYKHHEFSELTSDKAKEILNADSWEARIRGMVDFCELNYIAIDQCRLVDFKLDHVTLPKFKNVEFAVKCALNDALNGSFEDAISSIRDCMTLNGYDFNKEVNNHESNS